MSQGVSVADAITSNAAQTAVAINNSEMSIALIDGDSAQLELYKALLNKHGATVTTFKSDQEFLEKQSNKSSRYDIIVIDYHTDEKGFEMIARLQQKSHQNCKICVFSGNSLGKADRASLDGLGIRFVQKDRSACSKIMNMLSSPDLRKCSSCTRWKPTTEFSGQSSGSI